MAKRSSSRKKRPTWWAITRRVFKGLFLLIGLFLLYVIIVVIHGTIDDYQPEEKVAIELDGTAPLSVVNKAKIRLLNWNVGYGGLGDSSNFFYDDGGFFFAGDNMIRSEEDMVKRYTKGTEAFLKAQAAQSDFILLQEVDRNSKRSYYNDQYERYQKALPDFNGSFALNYNVARVPIPVCEPWQVMGKMKSGLATYSRFQAKEANRYQFPGSYGWPNRIFHLDRCMAVHRYPTSHPEGKELIVINTHNSAYDGGELKAQEMAYLKEFLLKEYEKGHYIIVGGDWNQCPPNFPFNSFRKNADPNLNPGNIATDFMPEGWMWGYDPRVPTNRALSTVYRGKESYVTLIDYYLVSPNIKINAVRGVDLAFEYSDHQPVLLEVELQGLAPEPTTPAADSAAVEAVER